MNAMDGYELKSRSYRVREQFAPGDAVTVVEPTERRIRISQVTTDEYEVVPMNPGDVFHVLSFTNAGFRGIEVSLRLADGRYVHGLSAGYLTAV